MRWKRKLSNLIVVSILSLAFTIVTLLLIIGPLHMNSAGTMNHLGAFSLVALLYWLFSLSICWCMYFALRTKPEMLYFTLMILGIVLIIAEIFIWANY
jgi:hypothetical protein